MEYPPNAKQPRGEPKPDKNVQKVIETDAVRRKKPLGNRFRETFFGGDLRTSFEYMIFEVMLPSAKDMIVDASSQGMERLIFGETRGRRRMPTGYRGQGPPRTQYNRMHESQTIQAPPQRQASRAARSVMDFDDIQIQSRSEAENVIDRLFDIIRDYGTATVADLYALTGLATTHTDNSWGWRDMRGSGVRRLRNGAYVLNLPDPSALSER